MGRVEAESAELVRVPSILEEYLTIDSRCFRKHGDTSLVSVQDFHMGNVRK